MKSRAFAIGTVVSAAAGALVVARRSDLGEDLAWERVDKPGRMVDVDGYGVHCVLQGEGPTVVLVHGFGGSTFSYREIIPLLAHDHEVVAVDLKGCGYSERDAHTGLSHGDQVTMLKGLLDVLDVQRAVFVGHSMGGAVVQRFAASHPQMVDALVLAASATGDERLSQHLGRGVPQAFAVRPLVAMLEGLTTAVSYALQRSVWLQKVAGNFSYMRIMSRRLVHLWSYDPSMLTDDVRQGYERPMRIRGTFAATLRSVSESARDEPIDRSRITMPVLLLCATDDRAVPLSGAQQLRQLLPQARLVVIEKAAHLLLEERPCECARAIEDFLREPRPEKPPAPPGP